MDRDTGVSVFTDVSKLFNRAGGGVLSAKFDARIAFQLPDHCSVFQAVITAIRKNYLVLTKSVPTTKNISIYTNRQAAFKSLKPLGVSSKIVKELHDFLVDLTSYFRINLQWIPAHNNIPGNCETDEPSKASTTLQLKFEKELIYIPLGTCRY